MGLRPIAIFFFALDGFSARGGGVELGCSAGLRRSETGFAGSFQSASVAGQAVEGLFRSYAGGAALKAGGTKEAVQLRAYGQFVGGKTGRWRFWFFRAFSGFGERSVP